MAHGSWLMAHGSWLMAHGSWLMAHGSWLKNLILIVTVVKIDERINKSFFRHGACRDPWKNIF
jgi:hypothetical protein